MSQHYTCYIFFTVSCPTGVFLCSNSQCIRFSYRCDGTVDCIGGSDEAGCDNNSDDSNDGSKSGSNSAGEYAWLGVS